MVLLILKVIKEKWKYLKDFECDSLYIIGLVLINFYIVIVLVGRLNVLLSGRVVVFILFDLEFELCVVIFYKK